MPSGDGGEAASPDEDTRNAYHYRSLASSFVIQHLWLAIATKRGSPGLQASATLITSIREKTSCKYRQLTIRGLNTKTLAVKNENDLPQRNAPPVPSSLQEAG